MPYHGSNSWVDFILWRKKKQKKKPSLWLSTKLKISKLAQRKQNWPWLLRWGAGFKDLKDLRKTFERLWPQTSGRGFKTQRVHTYITTGGEKLRSAVRCLPPPSSDLMEEGGSHTVLFSYKGSKGPSYPRRTDSVGQPSETEGYGQKEEELWEQKVPQDKRQVVVMCSWSWISVSWIESKFNKKVPERAELC